MLEPARMRPLTDLLPYEEARRIILEAVRPVSGTQRVPLSQAGGRVLAIDLVTSAPIPPFDRAAMDGYALRARDTRGATAARPRTLSCTGTIHAQAARPTPLDAGHCVRIATGALLPAGADAVAMVERTRARGDDVEIHSPLTPGENVSRAGSDFSKGALALVKGASITPARLAVAAAVGRNQLTVWRRPRVLILSTGSELREPGTRLRPGEIYNSNAFALESLLQRHGAAVERAPPVADDVDSLKDRLRTADRYDLVVVSGGSSAGERDLLRDAVAAVGRIEFHGVAVKPGKPLLYGQVRRRPLIGLPGNPASCLCDAYLFVVPALRRMAHVSQDPPRRVRAPLAARVAGSPGRHFFVPARFVDGRIASTYTDSGSTSSMAEADGYIEIPAGADALEAGTPVDLVYF